MNIFKKKVATIAALCCVGVLCSGFGFSALSNSNDFLKADAAETPAATNVEDLISVNTDGTFSGVIGYAATGGFSITKPNTLQTYKDTYQTYISDKLSGKDAYSASNYEGNLTYWSSYADSYANVKSFLFTDTTASVISFRTVYQGSDLYLMGNMPQTPYLSNSANIGGWAFIVNSWKVQLNRLASSNVGAIKGIKGINFDSSKNLKKGDELLITYGSTAATEGATYYVEISRYEEDGSLTEIVKESVASSDEIWSWEKAEANNTSNTYLAVGTSVKAPLILGGIEKPILDVNVAYTAPNLEGEEYATTEGTPLSSVTLETGYAFADSTALAKAGTNEYAGTYTGTYYGNAYTWNVLITVTAKEAETPAATNVEDLISVNTDGKFSGVIGYAATGGFSITKPNTLQTYRETYQTYISDKSSGKDTYSASVYDGNLTYWSSSSDSYSDYAKSLLFPTTTTESLISFRTIYQGENLYLMGKMPQTPYAYPKGNVGGWGFVVEPQKVAFNKFTGAGGNVANIKSFWFENSSKYLTAGDELLITYGSTTATDGSTYYVEISRYEEDGSLTKILKERLTSSEEIYVWDKATEKNTSNTYLAVGTSLKAPLVLGGIEKPILDVNVAYTAPNLEGEAYATTEDEPLSSVTLETGYAFADSTALAKAGTNEYAGTYTGTYYGNAYTWNALITMTANALPSYDVVLKYADGTVYETKRLKEGQTYDLETRSTTGKVFIGWLDGENKLYNAGYKVENLTQNVEFTLAEMEYKLADGASVRYKTENGNGGIRFVLLINKADYEKCKAYLSGFMGVIAPADEYVVEGNFISSVYADNFKGAIALDLKNNVETVENETTYLQVPFTMTNIKYSNFNRVYAANAYLTVTYADTNTRTVCTAYDAEKNSRSIYECSTNLLAKHYAAKHEGKIGTLSDNKVEILEAYVDQTVDIVITENATDNTLTVEVSETETGMEYRTETGKITVGGEEKEVEKVPYGVSATTTYENDVYTVTLTVVFDADNALDKEGSLASLGSDDKYHVPVTVRISNGTEIVATYRMGVTPTGNIVYKSVEYDVDTRTATIQFTYKA